MIRFFPLEPVQVWRHDRGCSSPTGPVQGVCSGSVVTRCPFWWLRRQDGQQVSSGCGCRRRTSGHRDSGHCDSRQEPASPCELPRAPFSAGTQRAAIPMGVAARRNALESPQPIFRSTTIVGDVRVAAAQHLQVPNYILFKMTSYSKSSQTPRLVRSHV